RPSARGSRPARATGSSRLPLVLPCSAPNFDVGRALGARGVLFGGAPLAQLTAPEEGQHGPERERGERAADSHDALRHHDVLLLRGVVAIAVENHALDARKAATLGRFEQTDPNVVRIVLDAVQIARDAAVRREEDEHARVRVLALARHPLIT